MAGLIEILDNPAEYGFETRTAHINTLDFEIKAKKKGTDGRMKVEGYASTFDTTDSYNDVMVKGAYKNSIKTRFKNDLIRFLWQHNARLGAFGIPIEMGEDSKGLWTVAEIIETQEARDNWIPQIQARGVQGLSVGFITLDAEFEDDEDPWYSKRFIKDVELIEWSAVTFPANEESWIEGIKNRQLLRARTILKQGGQTGLARHLERAPDQVSMTFAEDLAGRLSDAYKMLTGLDVSVPEEVPATDLRSRRREGVGEPPPDHPMLEEERERQGEEDDALPDNTLDVLKEWTQEFAEEDDAVQQLIQEIRNKEY